MYTCACALCINAPVITVHAFMHAYTAGLLGIRGGHLHRLRLRAVRAVQDLRQCAAGDRSPHHGTYMPHQERQGNSRRQER